MSKKPILLIVQGSDERSRFGATPVFCSGPFMAFSNFNILKKQLMKNKLFPFKYPIYRALLNLLQVVTYQNRNKYGCCYWETNFRRVLQSKDIWCQSLRFQMFDLQEFIDLVTEIGQEFVELSKTVSEVTLSNLRSFLLLDIYISLA